MKILSCHGKEKEEVIDKHEDKKNPHKMMSTEPQDSRHLKAGMH